MDKINQINRHIPAVRNVIKVCIVFLLLQFIIIKLCQYNSNTYMEMIRNSIQGQYKINEILSNHNLKLEPEIQKIINEELENKMAQEVDKLSNIRSLAEKEKLKKAIDKLKAKNIKLEKIQQNPVQRRFEELQKSDFKVYTYENLGVELKITPKFKSMMTPKAKGKIKKHSDGEYLDIGFKNFPFTKWGTFSAGWKINEMLQQSQYKTTDPEKASFFLIPIACEAMRSIGNTRVKGGLVAELAFNKMVEKLKMNFPYWNRTMGADHFYICTHMGAMAARTSDGNAVTKAVSIACAGDYVNHFYSPHKDIIIPPSTKALPNEKPKYQRRLRYFESRKKNLAFFAGNLAHGRMRGQLISLFGKDKEIIIRRKLSANQYERSLWTSKYCLLARGTKVNSPRSNEVVKYGCVPVIISDHYQSPFSDILNWDDFSITVQEKDIPNLKVILKGISEEKYKLMYQNVIKVLPLLTYSTKYKYNAFEAVMLGLYERTKIINRHYKNPVMTPISNERWIQWPNWFADYKIIQSPLKQNKNYESQQISNEKELNQKFIIENDVDVILDDEEPVLEDQDPSEANNDTMPQDEKFLSDIPDSDLPEVTEEDEV